MTDVTTDVSNADSLVSNEAENNQVQTVAYETYKKVLAQKKTTQANLQEVNAKLAEYEANAKAQAEETLKEQNRWEEIAKAKGLEAEDALTKLKQVNNSIVRAEKINAFENALGETLAHPSFVNHINTEAIVMTETGDIDIESLNEEVNRFRTEFGGTLTINKNIPNLPNNAPTNAEPRGLHQLTKEERAALRTKLTTKK